MTTVGEHIRSTDEAICRNIEALAGQRALLSQNLLSQLRNLVEGVAVRIERGSSDTEYDWPAIRSGVDLIKSRGKGGYRFLGRFYRLLEASVSHYTVDGDASERLMLKYYEYLLRIRALLRDDYGITVLDNLESFPVDLDPSLREYHEKIASRIKATRSTPPQDRFRSRYYIHKTRPFFVDGRVYYEVTFHRAVNKVGKYDRFIAFTDIDMTDKYAAMLTVFRDSIRVFGQTMPISIIRKWEVSIRPCELVNFARLLGITIDVGSASAEYRYLMRYLTAGAGNLIDLIDMPEGRYEEIRAEGTSKVPRPRIFPVLDEARRVIRSAAPGHNVIRYLMLRMRNQVLRLQYNPGGCVLLSDLDLLYGCIPFDQMPFCTSLPGHNPPYWDLVESLDATGREHELLARRVRNDLELRGMLYTPVKDLEAFGDVAKLIATHNDRLYEKHGARRLVQDKGQVFVIGYEDDTLAIVETLQRHARSGVEGYTESVRRRLKEGAGDLGDEVKRETLEQLFSRSKVALIHGAAGTGKTTMIDHIAAHFHDEKKLFLAHTNPAVDNLRRKVAAENSTFRTISSQLHKHGSGAEYDLLIIDECSTVGNADLLRILDQTSYELLVLVGDVFQIESIRFGNWFGIIRSFLPSTSVFELKTAYRTENESLRDFWGKVRNIEDDIAEVIARHGYSTVLDRTLFEAQRPDEIVLCLNYDGLYGINNVNRFLQGGNPNPATIWGVSTYKVGDPVLFSENERFSPVIHNNLKGWIVDIVREPGRIRFDVKLERPLSESEVDGEELEWVEESVVRFSVYDHDTGDEDDDLLNTSVPFQVAYAISIHKAQGLEYDSVKIVITDANEDDITHNVFYTAVTRARENLRIFWTPETQQRVLSGLRQGANPKDIALLSKRRGLTPLNGSRRAARATRV